MDGEHERRQLRVVPLPFVDACEGVNANADDVDELVTVMRVNPGSNKVPFLYRLGKTYVYPLLLSHSEK